MIGVMAHWVVMLGFMVLAWILFDIAPGFAGKLKYQLTMGNVIGGLLFGGGAVLLIGCEIRSYMRVGLGYLNTWVGLMGFAVGYLPFTLFYGEHKEFLAATVMLPQYKIYELVSDSVLVHKAILFGWWVLILAGLVWLVCRGVRNTGVERNDLLFKNTEDLQVGIENEAGKNNGRIGEVGAPMPVPGLRPEPASR